MCWSFDDVIAFQFIFPSNSQGNFSLYMCLIVVFVTTLSQLFWQIFFRRFFLIHSEIFPLLGVSSVNFPVNVVIVYMQQEFLFLVQHNSCCCFKKYFTSVHTSNDMRKKTHIWRFLENSGFVLANWHLLILGYLWTSIVNCPRNLFLLHIRYYARKSLRSIRVFEKLNNIFRQRFCGVYRLTIFSLIDSPSSHLIVQPDRLWKLACESKHRECSAHTNFSYF